MLAVAVLALGLLPQASLAAGESGIQLGTGGLKKDDEVYFGQHTIIGMPGTYNVPWIVLDPSSFLLSKYLLGYSAFRILNDNGYYAGSVLQTSMGTLYSDMFTTAEQAAIKGTTLAGDSMYVGQPPLSGQKLFPLSFDEVVYLGWDRDRLKASLISHQGTSYDSWWLRTSTSDYSAYAVVVVPSGSDEKESTTYNLSYRARPAFNLDFNAVLFISPAAGGKASGVAGPGALNANLQPSGKTEWKLTLLDNAAGSGRAGFAVSTANVSVGTAGGDVSVTYAGANTGADEYLSALLVDSANNVLYYGRLSSLAGGGSSGTQDITIPALAAGYYTLKLFTEQYNGDYKTDYASAFRDVDLIVSDRPPPTPVPTVEPGVPKTGDSALPGLWIGLALLAGVVLTASLMLGRGKRG